MPTLPQMEIMLHVSLSGQRGGPFVSTNGGKQNAVCQEIGTHANVLSSFSLKGSSQVFGLKSEENPLSFRVCQTAFCRRSVWGKVNIALLEHGKVCKTLLLSGEKGGPTYVGGQLIPLCVNKGKHACVLHRKSDRLSCLIVCRRPQQSASWKVESCMLARRKACETFPVLEDHILIQCTMSNLQVCFSQKSAFLLLSGFNTDQDTIFMEIQ